MTVEHRIEDPTDPFPIGMRVLAVDDDPTCLKLLETLLRRCKYHVTTTSQARTALNMLRENTNKFDLVISDVHMPDMDGFKLLELVGLEMDLPVIMLSANGDTKLVMKGVSHGACDYLLKPVRIEELKNIWQHVLRRKKIDSGSQKSGVNGGEGDPGSAGSGGLDQNGRVTKKRKDQDDDDDDDDRDENGDDNDDPSTQKKPRVVWSVELHHKFVAAVKQLGIDKAVPKKILDLMNVDKLTRENVASHLQKYRLYLKRISCVANQQAANMAVVFSNADPSYLHINSINAHRNFNPLSLPVPFQNQSFRSFSPSTMISRLNTPANMGLNLPPSVGIVHNRIGQSQNLSNSNEQIKYHDPNMIQRMPIPSVGGTTSHMGDLSSTIIDESTVFPLSTTCLTDAKVSSNGLGIANNMMMFGNGQDLPDPGRCTDSWSNPAQSSGFQSNTYPLSDPFKQTPLHNSSSRDSTITSRITGNQFDGSSMSSVQTIQSHNPVADSQYQTSRIGTSTLVPAWDNHNKLDSSYRPNPSVMTCSGDPVMPNSGSGCGVMNSLDHSLDMRNTIFQRDMDFNSMGQPNYGDTSMVRYDEVEKSTFHEAKLKQEYVMTTTHQQRPQGSYMMNHFGSLGDVVNGTMKQEHNNVGGDFDAFSLDTGNIM